MDINSILNVYGSSSIFANYDVSKINSTSTQTRTDLLKTDTYKVGGRTQLMSKESYDYSTKFAILNKARSEVDAISSDEDVSKTQLTEGVQGGGGGNSSSDSEASTETEVKIINGQAYMIITTTNEDGSTTVRKVKLGGSLAKGNDKTVETSSLADAVTM